MSTEMEQTYRRGFIDALTWCAIDNGTELVVGVDAEPLKTIIKYATINEDYCPFEENNS